MTARRLTLTLMAISCAGVMTARSDDVVPAARHLAEQIMGKETLPDFVGGPQELHFNNTEALPAKPDLPAAGPTPASVQKITVEPEHKSAALMPAPEQTAAPAVSNDAGSSVGGGDATEGDGPTPAPAQATVEPSNARPVPNGRPSVSPQATAPPCRS